MRLLAAERRKYALTPELERLLRAAYCETRTRAELVARLKRIRGLRPAWPAWVWRLAAQDLGLSRGTPRRPFTPEEDAQLRELMERETPAEIARRLHRSKASVRARCRALELRGRAGGTYTLRDLAECFGVPEATAERWIRAGLLPATGETVQVLEAAVQRFIRAHANEYELRRVNQAWFKSMLFGAGGDAVKTTERR